MRYVINYQGQDQSIISELQAIAEAIDRIAETTVETFYEEPEKPQEGQLVVADGVQWNPVSTGIPTPVIRLGSSWLELGSGGGGAPGSDGLSIYRARIYQRAASAPSTPTGGSYDFGTGILVPPAGWVLAPPASDGNPLYISEGEFSVQGVTGVDNTTTWTSPAILVQDGIDGSPGDPGISVHVSNIYRRASSAPATPTGGSYNFTTQTLTAPTDWFVDPPAGSDPLYVSTASWTITGQTGIDNSTTWSAPQVLVVDGIDGTDGTDGDDGLSIHVSNVYQRAASAPSTPSDGSYNFGTQVLTPPTGWSTSPPASDGNPLYVTTTSWSTIGQTGIDNTPNWTTPQIIVQDGIDGGDGNSIFYGTVFQRASSTPATPTGGSFNFTTDVLTPPSGWSASPPASNGNPLYASDAVFSVNGVSGIDNSPTWTTPRLFTQDGTDGSDGTNGTDGLDGADGLSVHVSNVYLRSATAPSAPSGGSYNFATNTLTPPASWNDNPPAGSNPLYISIGTFSVQGTTGIDNTVSWTTPQLLVQDGVDGGDGTDGTDGDDGLSVHVANVYQRAASAPGTPTGGSFNFATQTLTPPSGWNTAPPASDGNPLYVSTALFSVQGTSGIDNSTTWTAPIIITIDGIDGNNGTDAVASFLSNEAHVTPAGQGGEGYDLTNSGGTHRVYEGDTEVTTSANHTLPGGTDNGANWTRTQNGLTMTLIEATGVYSLSGPSDSWSTDFEVFQLRATYNGESYDKFYVIAKALAGQNGEDAGGFVVTVSGGSIEHNVSSGTAIAGIRVNSDGTIDRRQGGVYTQISTGTDWVRPTTGFGAYWVRFTYLSGVADGGDAINTWHSLANNRETRIEEATSDSSQAANVRVDIATDSDGTPIVASGDYSLDAINLP